MENEKNSLIFLFYEKEFKPAHSARDTEKVTFFPIINEKPHNQLSELIGVNKIFLNISFMKRVSGPVANITLFHMLHKQ